MFKVLDEKVLCGAQAGHEPYDHLFCENVVASGCREPLLRDLPQISGTGSHPLDRLKFGSRFADLVDDLLGPAFRQLMEQKFALDLISCSTVASVRGWSGDADGNIHTDIGRKVLTLLLYLTPHWASPDGRLRLLRSPRMDDYALEIEPLFGNLLVFRRSESSWHGHTRYYGQRIVLQINWMKPHTRMELVREKLAGLVKIPWTYFLESSLERGRSRAQRCQSGDSRISLCRDRNFRQFECQWRPVDDGMRQLKGWSMSSRPVRPARYSRPLLSLPPAQMASARRLLATEFLTRGGPVRGRNLRQIFSERDEGPMVDESLARVVFV